MRSRCSAKLRNSAEDDARVSSLTSYRIDPARRMRCFYIMDCQPDLLGDWSVIREWGRIGSPGQMRIATCPNEAEARAQLARARHVK